MSHTHSHPDSHGNGHLPHSHREERVLDRRRLSWALALTIVVAVAEAVGGYLSGSLSLVSDAGHMVTDASALILSMLALWFASKPADRKRTYGYYRLEILSALANGVMLALITVLIAVEAYYRLRHPTPVDTGAMAGIAAIGLVANMLSLFFLRHSHSMNVRGALLHVVGDTLSSVGVLVAAGVIALTGWLWIDPVISVGISIIIVVSAWSLVKGAVDVLLEAAPGHVRIDDIRVMMEKVPGVVSVHDLHVWTISSGLHALSAHLVVLDPMVCNNDVILSAVKHDLVERFGIGHTTIQIESKTYAHVGEVH